MPGVLDIRRYPSKNHLLDSQVDKTHFTSMTLAKFDAHRSMAVISSRVFRLGKAGEGCVTSGRCIAIPFASPMLGTADSLGKQNASSLVQ
jgi:hypothetical protein